MSRLGEQRGYTLIELLVATTVMLVVIGTTLGVLSGVEVRARESQDRTDAQDVARATLDGLARELRNLASPTPNQPQAVEKAAEADLVFQSVDPVGPNSGANTPNVRRVRYCLDMSVRDRGKLWMQSQTWTTAVPPAVPSTASCPDAAWSAQRLVSDWLINDLASRLVFRYNATTLTTITQIRATLWVDTDAARRPAATRLSTGVFLRNQNREPTAAFTATAAGSNGHVLLNGWASQDPEDDTLTYRWYMDGAEICAGAGISCDFLAPTLGAHSFSLTVIDSGGLEQQASPQAVVVT